MLEKKTSLTDKLMKDQADIYSSTKDLLSFEDAMSDYADDLGEVIEFSFSDSKNMSKSEVAEKANEYSEDISRLIKDFKGAVDVYENANNISLLFDFGTLFQESTNASISFSSFSGMKIAVNVADEIKNLSEIVETYGKISANSAAYEEADEILTYISQNADKAYIRQAAAFVKNAAASEGSKFFQQMHSCFSEMFSSITKAAMASLAKNNPALTIALACFEETAEISSNMTKYNDYFELMMEYSNACTALLGKKVEMYDQTFSYYIEDYSLVERYMVHLAQSRIVGEYYFYTYCADDSFLGYYAALSNRTLPSQYMDYYEDVAKQIYRYAARLKLKLSDNLPFYKNCWDDSVEEDELYLNGMTDYAKNLSDKERLWLSYYQPVFDCIIQYQIDFATGSNIAAEEYDYIFDTALMGKWDSGNVQLGYRMEDLDGNGFPELIIGRMPDDEPVNMEYLGYDYTNTIVALFTLTPTYKEGGGTSVDDIETIDVEQVLSSGARAVYYPGDGNTLIETGSSSASSGATCVCTLSGNELLTSITLQTHWDSDGYGKWYTYVGETGIAEELTEQEYAVKSYSIKLMYRPIGELIPIVANIGDSVLNAYKNFILNYEFLKLADLDFGKETDYYMYFHDLDDDGTPELFISNGYFGKVVRQVYCYTVGEDDIVVYLGTCRLSSGAFYVNAAHYPGLFASYYDYPVSTYYYNYKDGTNLGSEVVYEETSDISGTSVEQITLDDDLFRLATGERTYITKNYTVNSIIKMGWNNFLFDLIHNG